MGNWLQLKKTNLLMLLFGIFSALIFSKFEFPKIDAFSRDVLQLFNRSSVNSNVKTVNINSSDPKFKRPFSLTAIKTLIEKIEKQSPKSIVLLIEPAEINDSETEAREFLSFINSRNNIFLNTSTSRPGKLSFKDHPVLGKTKNLFSPPVATVDENIGPKDQKRRRTTVTFENASANETINEIQKLGLRPVPLNQFKYPIRIWKTTQVYFKTFKVGTFGNISSDEIDNLAATNTFSEKHVLIGAFDEFSFFAKPSIFDFFDKPTDDNFSSSYFPYHEYIANVLYLFESGEYIKYIEFPDLIFLSVICVALIILNVSLLLKLGILLSLIPFLILLEIFSYLSFDAYINLSQSFAMLIFLHVFIVPIIFIKNLSNLEKAKISEVNRAKIQALESISEKLAHDIRSPLSTAQLLLSKAKFDKSDHKDMIQLAIRRIDDMTQEILNKSKGQTITIDIFSVIKGLVHEKQISYSNIFFDVQSVPNLFCKIERSDLERVLSNVLDNSIAAVAPSNGRIDIKLKSRQSFIEIMISDDGIGIDSEILKKLGIKKVQSTKPNGNGVGLFHSKRIIEEYGGSFSIASKNSSGTVVSIVLPIMAG